MNEKLTKKFRMLRTGTLFASRFPGHPNFEDAPHGSAIFLQNFGMLRTGAPFYSKFSGCSARERYFERRSPRNLEDAPHGSTIFELFFDKKKR